jgi:hypothetical protein
LIACALARWCAGALARFAMLYAFASADSLAARTLAHVAVLFIPLPPLLP